MCRSNISLRKFLKLFLEIEFYRLVIYLTFVFIGYTPFSFETMFQNVVPIYSIGGGFIGSYLVFFAFIPYINILVHAMNEKQHGILVVLCLMVGTFFQTFLKAPAAFTYVGWFMVLYIIASYIRMYPKKFFDDKGLWGYTTVIMLMLSWGSVIAEAYKYHKNGETIFYYYVSDSNKILAVLTAICSFMFFKNLQLKYCPVINTIAASAFGVLLIHAHSDIMRQWLWKDTLKNASAYHTHYFVAHAIVSVIVVYVVCTLIDMTRIKLLERPVFAYFDRKIIGVK